MMKRSLITTWTLLAAGFGVARAQAPDTLRLGLGAAVRLAADRNAQVEQAAARLDQVQARVGVQRSLLYPQVYGSVGTTAHTLNTASFGLEFPTEPGQDPLFDPNGEVLGPVRLSDVRGTVTQTLFDWSAFTRVRSANAAVNAADAQLHVSAERAAKAAAMAYAQALKARQLYASRLADRGLAAELVSIAKEQLSSGVGVRLDVTRAEAQLAAVDAQVVAARNAVERADLALARAIGLRPGAAIVLTDSLGPIGEVTEDPEMATRLALERRADVAELDAQIRAGELQVSAIKAERLPSLRFVGAGDFIGKRWDNLLRTYDWGLEVSVPLFQGFRVKERAQEQQAQLRELQSRRRDLEDEIAFEVRAALLDLAAAAEQVAAARSRLQLAEQEVSDARDRYQSGVAGSADVVTASLRLTEARTAYSEALAAHLVARIALAAAEGNVTELR